METLFRQPLTLARFLFMGVARLFVLTHTSSCFSNCRQEHAGVKLLASVCICHFSINHSVIYSVQCQKDSWNVRKSHYIYMQENNAVFSVPAQLRGVAPVVSTLSCSLLWGCWSSYGCERLGSSLVVLLLSAAQTQKTINFLSRTQMKHWNCCFITLKYRLKATNPQGVGTVHSGMKSFMTNLICPCGTRPAQRFGRATPRHWSVEKSNDLTLKNSRPTLKSLKVLHIFCLTAAIWK